MTLVTLAVVFAYFTHPRDKDLDDDDGPVGKSPNISSHGANWVSRFKSYGFWRSTIIVLSAVPIAIFTNAMRVSGTGVLARYYGTRVADGFFHSFSGWVVYIVAFLMLFAMGWLLDRFKPADGKCLPNTLVPSDTPVGAVRSSTPANPASSPV